MARRPDGVALKQLLSLFNVGVTAGLTDGQLLERFALRHGEEAEMAFAALVERHGPMVLRTCRSILRDGHDVQDAFQATFLVLVRRGGTLWVRDSLGPWLHRVACRASVRAKIDARRRCETERRAAELAVTRSDSFIEDRGADLPALHEELDRLPDRYRSAIVLCDLEGRTYAEAARSLRCPVGTVRSRLARGRERLRVRLTRRGLAPAAGITGALAAGGKSSAAAPTALLNATAAAAVGFARDGSGSGSISAAAAVITRGVLRTMLLSRLRRIAGVLACLGIGAAGFGVAIRPGAVAEDQPTAIDPGPAGKLHEVLREATLVTSKEEDVKNRVYTLCEIAKAQARSGDMEGARATARLASEASAALKPRDRTVALIDIARARGAGGDRVGGLDELRLARGLVEQLRTESGRDWAWSRIARAQADLGDREAATATVRAMGDAVFAIPKSGNNLFSPLSELVGARVYLGDFDEAFGIVEVASIGDDYRKGRLLGVIASSAASPGPSDKEPRKLLAPEERAARREVLSRVDRAVEAFAFADQRPDFDLAEALARLGDFDEALRVARRYGKGPVQHPQLINPPTAASILGRIAREQGKAGRPNDARATFREAFGLLNAEARTSSQMADIAFAQAQGGEFESALKTLDTVDAFERCLLLAEMGGMREKSGDPAEAREARGRALADAEHLLHNPPLPEPNSPKLSGFVLDDDGKAIPRDTTDPEVRRRDDCLRNIAALRARLGDLKAAGEALESLTLEDYKGWAAMDVAEARAAAGDTEGTLAWALSLKTPGRRTWALRGLAIGTPKR